MKVYGMIDNTESISAISLVKDEMYGEEEKFYLYGPLFRFLSDDHIALLSKGTGEMAKIIMAKTKFAIWANVTGELISDSTELMLASIKKISANRELRKACEFIIKIMKYCTQESYNMSSVVRDITIEEVLGGFPLQRSEARNVYALSMIQDLNYDLPKHNFQQQDIQQIGYILYYLFRAEKNQYAMNRRTSEAFSFLGLNQLDIDEYRNNFETDYEHKAMHMQAIRQIFGTLDFQKYNLNPAYAKRVIRKVSAYYPEGGNPKIKKIIDNGVVFSDWFLDKKSDESIINLLATGLTFLNEGSNNNRDNCMEEYMRESKKKYGHDIERYGDAIYKNADDNSKVING